MALHDVDCTNMSNELKSLADQRMDLVGKKWVLCKCQHSIVNISNKTCMICDVSFAESWNLNKEFFEKQADIEKAAIDAIEEEEEEEEDELTFPPKTSVALKKFFEDHILEAYHHLEDEWKAKIADQGLGDTVQDTIIPFKTFYDTKDSQAKRSLLNQVRDAEDHMNKIEAFATILKDGQNA